MDLTFNKLSETNLARCRRWHPGFPNDGWTGGDWGNAMGGEIGEAWEAFVALVVAGGQAQNTVKKLRRAEEGLRGQLDPPSPDLLNKLGEELADVVIYADLILAHFGSSLGAHVRAKFNEVSERQGWPERL